MPSVNMVELSSSGKLEVRFRKVSRKLFMYSRGYCSTMDPTGN